VITVTFDRPVAGSLDRTVDPRGLFRIEPSVPGTVDWRDPVTIRAPLGPRRGSGALDGGRLTVSRVTLAAPPRSSPFPGRFVRG
jgi:hypothetical protein